MKHHPPEPRRVLRPYQRYLKQQWARDPDPAAADAAALVDTLRRLDGEIEALRHKRKRTVLERTLLAALQRLRAQLQQPQPPHDPDQLTPQERAHLHARSQAFDADIKFAIWAMLKQRHPWMASWFLIKVIGPYAPRPAHGRRPGNGRVFTSREELLEGLTLAIATLRQRKQRITQRAVADWFASAPGYSLTSDRQLRAWLKEFGLSWEDILTLRRD